MTSPHSPSERGGLATFTGNILKVLKDQGLEVELVIFKSPFDQSIKTALTKKYQLIINIHYMALFANGEQNARVVNFIHGSEICLTSPNLFKALYKKMFRSKFLKLLERSYFNLFISEFSMNVAYRQGLKPRFERDLVIPNGICLESRNPESRVKALARDRLIISCIARDVPHKNIDGVVLFCERLSEVSGREVELWLAPDCRRRSSKISLQYIDGSDQERDELYKRAHLNLLLSLDHSHKGFFEGFGLVILEAALFNTPSIGLNQAGISESIHDSETGWLIPDIDIENVRKLWSRLENEYSRVAQNCFIHTKDSHGLEIYRLLFRELLS